MKAVKAMLKLEWKSLIIDLGDICAMVEIGIGW